MCTVSVIMDHYGDKWSQYLRDNLQPTYMPPTYQPVQSPITPEEIKEFRILLERARKYDREHNQPDCELESKRQKLKDLAAQLGVEISFV